LHRGIFVSPLRRQRVAASSGVSIKRAIFFAGGLIGFCLVLSNASSTEDPPITLPAYEVKGIRPWLYAEIPGYQILSLATEKDTRAILEKLQAASRFTPLFFPRGYTTTLTARSTLFLHHFADQQTVDDATERLQLSVRPKAFTVTAGDTFIEFPTPERITAWLKGRQLPSDFFSASELVTPHIPAWYREGLHVLITNARLADQSLVTASLNWHGTVVQPLHELLRVATTEQLNAVDRAHDETFSAFRMGAVLFVHWGFFGEGGQRRATFLEFVDAATRTPADEALFRQYFHLTFAEAEAELAAYLRKTIWRPARLDLPGAANPLPTPLIRPATAGEVARIVGESYLLLGDIAPPVQRAHYQQTARNLLAHAYAGGDRDPRLLAQLGFVECAAEHWDEALAYLETSTAAGIPLPRAYTTLALLRLRKLGARLGVPASLTEEQFRSVVAPAYIALSMQPVLADACTIAEDVFLRKTVVPTSKELNLLEAAVRRQPRDVALLANAAAIDLAARRFDEARGFLDQALKWPETEASVKTTLANARAKIPQATPAP
jgi:hypothetical protein